MAIFCRNVERILLLRHDELVSSAAMPNSLALIGQTLSQKRLSMTSTLALVPQTCQADKPELSPFGLADTNSAV